MKKVVSVLVAVGIILSLLAVGYAAPMNAATIAHGVVRLEVGVSLSDGSWNDPMWSPWGGEDLAFLLEKQVKTRNT